MLHHHIASLFLHPLPRQVYAQSQPSETESLYSFKTGVDLTATSVKISAERGRLEFFTTSFLESEAARISGDVVVE